MYECLRKPKLFLYLKVLLCIITAVHSYSQNRYESITTADGLSQGMVFDLLQDTEGFIWIATKDGLNRYDGYGFKIFTNDPYNTQSISNNSITKLLEDRNGRIWAGSENSGINVYDKKKGVFYRLQNNPSTQSSISGNNIRAIEELPDGRILVSTVGKGLNIIELTEGYYNKSESPNIRRIDMPDGKEVYGIGKDKNGIVYIGSMDGAIYVFDYDKVSFTLLPDGRLYNNGYLAEDGSILINNNLYLDNGKQIIPLFDTNKMPEGNIIFRPNSSLWENHHRESYFYDICSWKPGQLPNWNEKLPFDKSTRIIYPFIIDKSSLLWTGTVGYGIRKYNTTKIKFKPLADGKSIRLIKPYFDNEILCATYGYPWVKLKNEELVDNDVFNHQPVISQVDNIIISKNGDFYFKSDDKGYLKYNPITKAIMSLPQINPKQAFGKKQPFIEDNMGTIWFPNEDSNITLYNTQSGMSDVLSINPNGSKLLCTALYEDKGGVFWVGTETGFAKVDINRNNISSSVYKWYYNNPRDRNSISYENVTSFLDDPHEPNKYIWISTKGGGLNRMDKITGDFLHLTSKDGLPDKVVYGLLQDDAKNIWGSTNKGLFCLTINNSMSKTLYSFRHFTKRDGLQDDEFNTGAFAKLSNGKLAFGGINGLNVFDPKEVIQDVYIPNVFIVKILIGNQPITPNDKSKVLKETIEQTKSITLNHLQDILTLEFSSLDYTNPSQNKYRYQLVGIDDDWVQSDTRRSATYLHLPYGKFIFKVQGSNSLGVWNEKITELEIVVLPPWWATWWAYIAYLILFGFMLRAYFQYKLNQSKIQSQLVLEQNEAKRIKELDIVKTQLYTNITHEFRTPLTVILGMVQQIKSGTKEHFDSGLDMIERNGKNLLNLVNEMLDLSKLEAGKMELNVVKGDVLQFLRYIVESFHSMAESQGKQMHYLASLDYLYTMYDAEKLRQIISNILSNALKFTESKGNIYVSITAEDIDSTPIRKLLIIKIKDTGTGIPEDQIYHIFDRFYQVDKSHTRKAEGTGIGLALTKELVQLMGGTVQAKSPPIGARMGTEFTVTLPMNLIDSIEEWKINDEDIDSRQMESYKRSPAIHYGKEQQIKKGPNELILLVEDNADVVAYTASCLPEYRLAVGRDGKEGFDIACDLIPDLIITDVMMPLVDGFEMSKRLRKDERTSHIPIIMLTAKADMESKMEGLEHGADAYLEKPFYKDELKLRIKKLLEHRKQLHMYYSKLAGIKIASDDQLSSNDTLYVDYKKHTISVTENVFVKKVREEIEVNMCNENFTVEQLAKKIFMSQSQLHRKLSALTGFSPNHYIRILRIQKARILLKESEESIATIAEKCGFSDASYFGKVFKHENHMTPQEFRNE